MGTLSLSIRNPDIFQEPPYAILFFDFEYTAVLTSSRFGPFKSSQALHLSLSTWKPRHLLGHLAIHLSQMCHTPLGLGKRVYSWSQSRATTALQGFPFTTRGTSVRHYLFCKAPAEPRSLAQRQRRHKLDYFSMQSLCRLNFPDYNNSWSNLATAMLS